MATGYCPLDCRCRRSGGGDRRDGRDGSSHSRTEGNSGREYPAEPQVVHREGPRESAGYACRGTISLAGHPILGLLTPVRPIGGAGRAPTVVVPRLALKSPGTASWMRGRHRWLARWVNRGAPAVGDCLPCVPWASHRLVETKWAPWVGLAP